MTRKRKSWGYDSRGIPFTVGCLPVLLIFAALIAMPLFVPDLIERCTGIVIENPRGRGAGAIIIALEVLCSPMLVWGTPFEKTIFAVLLAVFGFAVFAWFWIRRHQAYWDIVRANEKARRQEKKRVKMEALARNTKSTTMPRRDN